jgi:hypothetical protein
LNYTGENLKTCSDFVGTTFFLRALISQAKKSIISLASKVKKRSLGVKM